jgi:uncharacterized protein
MNHDSYPESYIRGILQEVRTVAIVGASANPVRPSYFVLKYLIDKGYTVFPVNPGQAGKEILGRRSMPRSRTSRSPSTWSTCSAAPTPCRGSWRRRWRSSRAPRSCGCSSASAMTRPPPRPRTAGLKVVMNRCPKIEYGKLSGEWGWVGGYSGALSSQRQRLHSSGKMQSLGIARKP